MTFLLSSFVSTRPYLYHLTAATNINSILAESVIDSALEIFGDELRELACKRRKGSMRIKVGDREVWIRDQLPLCENSIEFEPGWNFARFVEHINRHVFFWPGLEKGPIKAGMNHFSRYSAEKPRIIRVSTREFFEINSAPLFSKYNSGAPRFSGGYAPPRGASTFVPADSFVGVPSKVIEVVFRGTVLLPSRIEISCYPTGPWRLSLSSKLL